MAVPVAGRNATTCSATPTDTVGRVTVGTVSHEDLLSTVDKLAGPAAPADLHVMSFNLRYASVDGPHRWAGRRPVVRSLLGAERPDLIGTQEGLAAQLDDVRADLGPAYGFVGTGREGGRQGEFSAVFYRVERLTALQHEVFWLSDTPDVVGSNTWGARCVRIVTWVRFLDSVTGGQFYAVNTHLDHISEYARQRAAALIRDRLAGFETGLPVVLTGDFNTAAGPESPAYRFLTGPAGLVDTWTAAPLRGAAYSTWHGFGPLVTDGPRIDWILVSPGVTVAAAVVNPFRVGDDFPSDHLPVQARIRLPES
jgi:endonuclease/exonuclease/phosphatase family metal-dependent hydrolase